MGGKAGGACRSGRAGKPFRGFAGRALLRTFSALLAAALLSGCAVIPADITELESLPKLTPEQQAIESALQAKVGNRFILRYPLEGNNRSAFVLRPGEGKSPDEAYAFYSPNSTTGPYIAYLAKVNGKWKDLGSISSAGSDIDRVDFDDFDGDGTDEIAVGWRSFDTNNLVLMVYTKTQDNRFTTQTLGNFTKLVIADLTGDRRPDILKLKLDATEKQATASLIASQDGKLREVAATTTDGTVTGYTGVYSARLTDGTPAVLVDGEKAGRKLSTELLYYKNGALHSPFYEQSQNAVTSTLRSDAYPCSDLDQDGNFEIPVLETLPHAALKKGQSAPILADWSDYNVQKKSLVTKYSDYMDYTDRFCVRYPSVWKRAVTVTQPENGVWNFVEWNAKNGSAGNVLFSIRLFKDEVWSEQQTRTAYTMLADPSGVVFAVKMGEEKGDDPLYLSLDEVRKNFSVL